MTATTGTTAAREELEAKILLAALKQSFERGDTPGTVLVYRELGRLLKSRQGEALARAGTRVEGSLPQDARMPAPDPEVDVLSSTVPIEVPSAVEAAPPPRLPAAEPAIAEEPAPAEISAPEPAITEE